MEEQSLRFQTASRREEDTANGAQEIHRPIHIAVQDNLLLVQEWRERQGLIIIFISRKLRFNILPLLLIQIG